VTGSDHSGQDSSELCVHIMWSRLVGYFVLENRKCNMVKEGTLVTAAFRSGYCH
jgi:hypothetical protein